MNDESVEMRLGAGPEENLGRFAASLGDGTGRARMNSSHLKERIPAQLSHVSNVPPKWKDSRDGRWEGRRSLTGKGHHNNASISRNGEVHTAFPSPRESGSHLLRLSAAIRK